VFEIGLCVDTSSQDWRSADSRFSILKSLRTKLDPPILSRLPSSGRVFNYFLQFALYPLFWHQTCFYLVGKKPAGFENSHLRDYPVEVITDGPETFLCALPAAVVTDPSMPGVRLSGVQVVHIVVSEILGG
jgi:hypothetical protein